MATLSTDVLVIGGGATGAGVAWDAALRGYDVVLVDRARPGRGDERALPRSAALGRPLRGQGPARGRGVHRREPHPQGDHAATRSRTSAGSSSPPRSTTPRTPTCSPRDAATPASTARRSTRRRRCARSRCSTRASRACSGCPTPTSTCGRPCGRWPAASRRAAGACCPTTRSSPSTATAIRSPARGCAAPRTGEEIDVEARVTVNASGAWAGDGRGHGRDRGRPRAPGPGDHDRDEPPAGEHVRQPLPDADRRRHHRADPDGVRDRDDRRAHRRSRRPHGAPVRGRRDARRRREARAGLPPGAGAAGVDRRASAVRGRQGVRHRHARRHARARAARPRRARRRPGVRDDHRRQAHDLPADGRGDDERGLQAPRRRASVHDQDRAAARARRRARPTTSASGWAARRRTSPTSS